MSIRVDIDNNAFDFLSEYLSIIIFSIYSFSFKCGFFILINIAFSPNNPDPEKLSTYECGLAHLVTLELNLM